jgi:hypothetical protein
MPVDFSAYLPQRRSPLDVQNALMQRDLVESHLQQNQLAAMQQQKQLAEAEAVRRAVIASGGDPVQMRQALVSGGHVEPLMKLDKNQAEVAEIGARTGKEQTQARGLSLDNMHKATSELAQRWSTVKTPEDVVPLYQRAVQDGLLDRDTAIAEINKTPIDPAQLSAYAADQQRRGMSMVQKLEQAMKEREYGLKERKQTQDERNDVILPDGRVNQPLVDSKQRVAKAGASNVNVKVEAKMGESLAKEIGPMAEASYSKAQGAQQQIENADSLIKAVEEGKAYTGPTANARLRLAQIGATMGIAGKTTEEKILNTRAAIQGLAQATVAARGALKGQGQVSDYEGRLLQKAASGEIDDMTGPEVVAVANVNKRLAQLQIRQHGEFVEKMRKHPSAAPLVDLFEPNTGGAAPKTLRFDAKGNPL